MCSTKVIKIKGRVQGVGFRPFVFSLAMQYKLCGFVQNNMDGVYIVVQGTEENIISFIQAVQMQKPRLAKIYALEVQHTDFKAYHQFEILTSNHQGKSDLVLPVDASVCSKCIAELLDPENRRYLYPFINCTDCGPRYTIITGLPYDRVHTTMNSFPMCEMCQKEYQHPKNRRHHAQPNACPVCGPTYTFYPLDSGQISISDSIVAAVHALESGKIIAIKGIGGYHLVCDAQNEVAIQMLRKRKKRQSKPLAIMARNLEVLKQVCHLSATEQKWLESVEAPIVLCQKKRTTIFPEQLAPGLHSLGVMLPYAPIHIVLFKQTKLDFLVMTSANPSKLPMLYQDESAQHFLSGLADGILTHNREIVHPVDDSVVQLLPKIGMQMIRRARGFAPEPMLIEQNVDGIVALGSQQKNTFAFGRNQQIFLGPHIGDLDALEMIEHDQKVLKHLLEWLDIQPKLIVIDQHPLFSVRSFASDFGVPIYEVQHHHAHMVSCMTEHGMTDAPAYGIVLDGTGYGSDGKIWGFEILYGSPAFFERKGHLVYTALPGGEKSILTPWKNAVGMLLSLFGSEKGGVMAQVLFPNRKMEIHVLKTMVEKEINSPLAGTCGRLFDAVSAMLGVCEKQNYDGEAAILLSEYADITQVNQIKPYAYTIKLVANNYEISFSEMLLQIYVDIQQKENRKMIVSRFHQTIVDAICDIMIQLKNKESCRQVFCSGGSFQNPYLVIGLKEKLSQCGFSVYFQQQVPTNDGGLSLGQLRIGQSYLTSS